MTSMGQVQVFGNMSPKTKARLAGVLYLIVIVGGIFAEVMVRGRLVVHGDAAATAHNITSHETLYRLGFAVEVFYCLCNVPLALLLFDIFGVVNRTAAMLMVVFSLIGTAIEGIALLAHFAPLVILGKGTFLAAFTPEQLQSASYLSLQLFEHGFDIALSFFGFFCLSLAYQIIRSTFFPRIIGALLAIQGTLYLTNAFANFIAPEIGAKVFPFLAVAGLGEISFCLWLLIIGVNVERWRVQAGQRQAI